MNLCIDHFTPHARLCICEREAITPPPSGFLKWLFNIYSLFLAGELSYLFRAANAQLNTAHSQPLTCSDWPMELSEVLLWVSGVAFDFQRKGENKVWCLFPHMVPLWMRKWCLEQWQLSCKHENKAKDGRAEHTFSWLTSRHGPECSSYS